MYKWFGVTRQAHHQSHKHAYKQACKQDLVLDEVRSIREVHEIMGTRKIHNKLYTFLEESSIKIGRDALFTLLRDNHLLVRPRRRGVRTTYSNHWMRKYTNLIQDTKPTRPNQQWVSDITYWRVVQGFFYISFITDAYSHKIVGHHVASTLETKHSVCALKMAIASIENTQNLDLIHHSDRGSQYCSAEYVKQLNKHNIGISMTENGDPRENAIAERINGIIKNEYLNNQKVKNLKEARQQLHRAVLLYNQDRPHLSIGYNTPSEVHSNLHGLEVRQLWKNYYPEKCKNVNPI